MNYVNEKSYINLYCLNSLAYSDNLCMSAHLCNISYVSGCKLLLDENSTGLTTGKHRVRLQGRCLLVYILHYIYYYIF
jgi:hypothetical protein